MNRQGVDKQYIFAHMLLGCLAHHYSQLCAIWSDSWEKVAGVIRCEVFHDIDVRSPRSDGWQLLRITNQNQSLDAFYCIKQCRQLLFRQH
jgi:hypothetical protein